MWYIVIMSCRLHWDSEYDKTFSSIVYAISTSQALEIAEQDAFTTYGAVGWHEIIECGLTKPKVVMYD